jgi:hypothetical protein
MDIIVRIINTPPYFSSPLIIFHKIRFNISDEYIYLPPVFDDENNNYWLYAIVNPS